MKKGNVVLDQHLRESKHFICADLFRFIFSNGQSFYFCDFDIDVTFDGNIYLHDACIVKRTGTEIGSNISVDKMSLSIYCDEDDQPQGTPLMHMAKNGGLDGAILSCTRAFFDETGQIIGCINLFEGLAEVRKGGGMELKIDVKSKIQQLNVGYPQRRYYPTCAFSLYSKACGVDPKQYSWTCHIEEVEDPAHFTVDISNIPIPSHAIDGFFSNGVIQFLSGDLVGKGATIKSNHGGNITLLVSEEGQASRGDVVKIFAGCDHTHNSCINKFHNVNGDRATPYIPLKESII